MTRGVPVAAAARERARLARLLRSFAWGQLALVLAWAVAGLAVGEPPLLAAVIVPAVGVTTALTVRLLSADAQRAAAWLMVIALWSVLAGRLVERGALEPAPWFLFGIVVAETGMFLGTRWALVVTGVTTLFGGAVAAAAAGGVAAIDPETAQRLLAGALLFALLVQLQRASAELYGESAARERALFEAAPAALAVIDASRAWALLDQRGLHGRPDEAVALATREPEVLAGILRIVEVNPAARALGFDPVGPAGRPPARVNLPAVAVFLEALAGGARHIDRELDLQLRDGEVRRVIARLDIPADPAQLEHVVLGVVDVTEQRRLEETARDAQRLETVSRLAGGIAHDFNNVLTVMRMGVDRLARALGDGASQAPSDSRPTALVDRPAAARSAGPACTEAAARGRAAQRRDLDRMRDAVARAAARTRQLLLFSRREVARPVVLELGRALTELAPLLGRTLDDRITIEVDVDGAPGAARIDPTLFEQAILNLVANAADAMPDGGALTLRACPRRVAARELTTAAGPLPAGDYVAVEVADTGHGMTPEGLARAFEPFFTTKAGARGAGLGLSIVHGIAVQAGGVVTIDSAPGRGTTVTLLLPREAAAPEVTASPATAVAGERVLLVEDEDGVREVAQASLEEAGYRVVAVRSGAEALAAVERDDGVDLVVSDLVMPGLSGRELAERLRRAHPELPVVFVSGFADGGDPAEGLPGVGAVRFLPKPFTADELLASIRAALPAPGARP